MTAAGRRFAPTMFMDPGHARDDVQGRLTRPTKVSTSTGGEQRKPW